MYDSASSGIVVDVCGFIYPYDAFVSIRVSAGGFVNRIHDDVFNINMGWVYLSRLHILLQVLRSSTLASPGNVRQ